MNNIIFNIFRVIKPKVMIQIKVCIKSGEINYLENLLLFSAKTSSSIAVYNAWIFILTTFIFTIYPYFKMFLLTT